MVYSGAKVITLVLQPSIISLFELIYLYLNYLV